MTKLKITAVIPDSSKYESVLIYSMPDRNMKDIMVEIDRECKRNNIPSKWLLLYVDNYNRIDVYVKIKHYQDVIK